MDIEKLSALVGRWPNDTIVSNKMIEIRHFPHLFDRPSGKSLFEDALRIDDQDARTIAEFAQANGMEYIQRSTIGSRYFSASVPAWLGAQAPAQTPVFVHELKAKIHGHDCTMVLAYSPVALQANDGSAHSLARKSIIIVSLPKLFPQMVLDSNKNDQGLESTIPSSFKPEQKMDLEGDFAKYFDFYAPSGLQVDTLSVLAPNFMQILIDSSATFDVEFRGHEVTLVTKEPLYTPEVMETALRALDAQFSYLDRLLLSWNYTPKNQPFDLLEKTTLDGGVFKLGSLRFGPAETILAVLFVIALIGVLGALMSRYVP